MSTGVCVCVGLGMAGPYTIVVGGEEVEPLFVADFKNGVYLVDGEAADLEDIFVQDLNWGQFNPGSDIVPDVGLTRTGGYNPSPVVASAILAGLLNNSSVIMQWTWNGGVSGDVFLGHSDLVGYADEHVVRARGNGNVEMWDYGDGLVIIPYTSGPGKLAATFTPARMAISVKGAAVQGFDPEEMAELTAIVLRASVNHVLEQVAFYPPLGDGALPALSALE